LSKFKKRINNENDILSKLPKKEKRVIETNSDDVLDFLESKPNSSKEEVEKQREKLDKKVKPILEKAEAQQEMSDYCRNIKKRINDADDLGDRIDKKGKSENK